METSPSFNVRSLGEAMPVLPIRGEDYASLLPLANQVDQNNLSAAREKRHVDITRSRIEGRSVHKGSIIGNPSLNASLSKVPVAILKQMDLSRDAGDVQMIRKKLTTFIDRQIKTISTTDQNQYTLFIAMLGGYREAGDSNLIAQVQALRDFNKFNEELDKWIKAPPEGELIIKQKAAHEMRAAALNHSKYLDLNDANLSSLPMICFNMPPLSRLEVLSLANNDLSALPPGILDSKTIKVLRLDGNRSMDLKSVFDKLPSLERLALEDMDLTTLPTSFWSLKSLDAISLKGNSELGDLSLGDFIRLFPNLNELTIDKRVTHQDVEELKEAFEQRPQHCAVCISALQFPEVGDNERFVFEKIEDEDEDYSDDDSVNMEE